MFRHYTVILFASLVLTLYLSTHYSFAKNVKCEDEYADMKWDPKDHDSNNPSSKEFSMLTEKGSLCEISKCVDMEECTNHDAVDWQKFKNSPAYELSEDDEQKCLAQAQKEGNGQDGLVGYEVLACGIGDY